jgi:hypothetical protein
MITACPAVYAIWRSAGTIDLTAKSLDLPDPPGILVETGPCCGQVYWIKILAAQIVTRDSFPQTKDTEKVLTIL